MSEAKYLELIDIYDQTGDTEGQIKAMEGLKSFRQSQGSQQQQAPQPVQGQEFFGKGFADLPEESRSAIIAQRGDQLSGVQGGDALRSVKAQQASGGKGFGEFPEERGETRAAQQLPELGQGGLLAGEDQAKVAALAPVLLSTTNPQEIAEILTSNIPNIGISQDPSGNLLATNNATGSQVILNKPGLSQIDILQGLGIATAFTPSAKGVSGVGVPALTKLAGRSAATQAGIESAQALAGGEFNPEDVVLAGVAAPLGQVVGEKVLGPLAGRVSTALQTRGRTAAAEEVADVAASSAAGREASEATGIRLFQGQQTTIPAQLEKQSFLSQLPAGARKASNELRAQNAEAGAAVDDLLGLIAADDAVTTGASRFRSAAQASVESVKRARSEAASPIYKQAFRRQRQGKNPLINTDALKTKISSMAKQFDPAGQIAQNLNKSLNKITTAGGELQKLHLAKIELNQTIDSFGEGAVGNTTKRFLSDVVRDLTDDLAKQSPSYRAARSEFIRLSPEVERVTESIIGKIAKTDDTQLKNISRRIFDPAEANIKTVLAAKKVIESSDPEAWNLLLRSEVERRIGSVKADLVGAGLSQENIPGQLSRAIFGNKKQRDILFNSADQGVRQNLSYLETALKRASLGRGAGSQTAGREEIKKELRGGFAAALRDLFSKPMSTVVGAGEDAAFDRRVRILTESMFDPQWRPQVKALRAAPPKSSKAEIIAAQLFRDVASTSKPSKETAKPKQQENK
jgi:hypothetical protein